MLRPQDLLVGESDSQNFYFVYSVRVRRLEHVRFGWHTVEGVGHGLRSHNSAAVRRRRTVETHGHETLRCCCAPMLYRLNSYGTAAIV